MRRKKTKEKGEGMRRREKWKWKNWKRYGWLRGIGNGISGCIRWMVVIESESIRNLVTSSVFWKWVFEILWNIRKLVNVWIKGMNGLSIRFFSPSFSSFAFLEGWIFSFVQRLTSPRSSLTCLMSALLIQRKSTKWPVFWCNYQIFNESSL